MFSHDESKILALLSLSIPKEEASGKDNVNLQDPLKPDIEITLFKHFSVNGKLVRGCYKKGKKAA
jgi:hypothetical protein